MNVRFFYGPGSRYSYLAATQLAAIIARTGARFMWIPVYGPDLRQRAHNDPFKSPTGAYDPRYRDQDVQRWAAHYDVPCVEPGREVDWLLVTRACAAADLLGAGEAFAMATFARSYGKGRPPDDAGTLQALARDAGLDAAAFAMVLAAPELLDRLAQNTADAANSGAFGLPSFVTEDGALFFGQDRLVLLEKALRG